MPLGKGRPLPLGKGRMAKRLRGWQMEMESGRVSHATLATKKEEEEKESPMANKLLSLWAHGSLSAKMIRDLADLAIQEGASHPELLALGKAGNWGAQPGNVHMQIMNRFCKNMFFCDNFNVEVACIDPKTSKETKEDASIFLPHMVFAKLFAHFPTFFNKLFPLADLESFWERALANGDDRLDGHPMVLEKTWKSKCIPLFVHGDGVEFHSRDSLMVWSWGPMLSKLSSLENHLLMTAWPKSCSLGKGTWDPMWCWLQWSFKALAAGHHPGQDPWGKPLEKGSPFWELQGQPLHPHGYKGIIWCIIGDNEFGSNTLQLPHWNSHWPCWLCDCQNFPDSTASKSVKEICLEKQDFYIYSQAEQLAEPYDHHLFGLPGVSCKMVRGDPLHVLFTHGLYGHLMGSCLHYACYFEGPGKVCKVPAAERLAIIFKEVQVAYSQQDASCRMTNLRLSMFCDAKKPWANCANLDTKGGEGKHLLPALLPVLEKIWSPPNAEQQKMLAAMANLEKLVAI